MKKRKELDALVPGGKLGGKRIGNGVKKSQVRTESKISAHQLLGNDSDSSDLDDFSILNPRRGNNKKSGRGLCAASCFPLCLVFLVTTCIVALVTLLWLHLGLREDLDLIRKHLQKVEAQSKETPEALHDYHIQLKSLEFNITSISDELKKLSMEISSISEEFKLYKVTTNSLKESIAAAPEMKSLPKDVITVSQTTAALGSKITLLETMVNDLKSEHASLNERSEKINKDHEIIKANVSELMNKITLEVTPRNNAETTQSFKDSLVAYVQKEVLKMEDSVDELNSTLLPRIQSLSTAVDSLSDLNGTVMSFVDELKTLHVSSDLLSSNIKNGSSQYFLHEAIQTCILRKDMSRKMYGTQNASSEVGDAFVDCFFTIVNRSFIQDFQNLNQTLVKQAAEQKSFQASTNQNIQALTAKIDVCTKLAEVQQGLKQPAAINQANSVPKFIPPIINKESIENSSTHSIPEDATFPVPTNSKLLNKLRRSQRPLSNPSPGKMLR